MEILFATTGFQSGALKYAKEHGISLVKISEGKSSYETRSIEPSPEPPAWLNIPKFIGWSIEELDNGNTSFKSIDFRDNGFQQLACNGSNK